MGTAGRRACWPPAACAAATAALPRPRPSKRRRPQPPSLSQTSQAGPAHLEDLDELQLAAPLELKALAGGRAGGRVGGWLDG